MHEITTKRDSESSQSESSSESSKILLSNHVKKSHTESTSGPTQKSTISTSSKSSTSSQHIESNKYDDDDFVTTETKDSSKKSDSLSAKDSSKKSDSLSNKSDRPQEVIANKPVEFDDDKSTVSEISEDIMVESQIDKSNRSKAIDQNLLNVLESESNDSSSSTDTQILLLNRTPRAAQQQSKSDADLLLNDQEKTNENNTDDEEHIESEVTASIGTKIERDNQNQNKRIVDSIEDTILTETISQMIKIRGNKIQKIGKVYTDEELEDHGAKDIDDDEEANHKSDDDQSGMKIFIPSINLDDDLQDGPDGSKSTYRGQSLKEKIAQLKIPYKKEKIDKLTDMAISNYFWQKLEKNQYILCEDEDLENLMNDENLIDYFKSDRESVTDVKPDEDTSKMELKFKRMLLDLVSELLHDLYLEKYEQPKSISNFFPGIKKTLKKQNFRSIIRGPVEQTEAQQLIRNKVNKILKLAVSTESFLDAKPQINAKSKWRSGKKLDLVDNLLDTEMREQEHEWSNYELEEYEAKILISNTIFDMILKDTVDCFHLNMLKKSENR